MKKLRGVPAAGWMLTVTLICGVSSSATASDETSVDPVQMIAAMEEAFGVTPGQRRNHTKGTCAVGEFTGLPEAQSYSRSLLFAGVPVPVVARFSLGGGNPQASDAGKGVRGMALQFQLPGESLQHMTMINVPVFGASVPKTFYDLMVALAPDPVTGSPNPEHMKAFMESHPDFHGMADFIKNHNPPPSYANSRFYSLHAFHFIDQADARTLVRWYFHPQDGVEELSEEKRQNAPDDFLEAALMERTQQGPVKWDMFIVIGQPGDAETDPSQPWPDEREQVKVGTLTLTNAMAQQEGTCETINFDPLVVADGIVPTDDPVLKARSGAYAVSFGKRLSGQ